ncbi:uncharacterized protein [Littorina saxatilis]|uniref:uncharacterized protein n=1 Tax=Littorina saxatilis TaxID=31220 RepID=UPI0038B4819B
MTANSWVLGVLGSGFRLPWAVNPARLTRSPPPVRPPASAEARDVLDEEVAGLLSKQAVEEVFRHDSLGFYGRLFVIPKSSGGGRPVLDLSPLNKFLRTKQFRMETPASIRESIRPGDWATSVDLSDAYFHVLVHPKDRKWLRFRWRDKLLQFRALPFGLSLAPWAFTRIVREFCLSLRKRGIRIRAYWLILPTSFQVCNQHTQILVREANTLGFSVNSLKSELVPSQEFTFLGMDFNTVSQTVRPAMSRILRLRALLSALLRRSHASARVLTSLLGMMESLAPLLPLGRLHKREFQRQFRDRWSQTNHHWDSLVPLRPWLKESTTQWSDNEWLLQGVPINLPPPTSELFTDASHFGWGAHMDHLTAAGMCPASATLLPISLAVHTRSFTWNGP